MLRDVARKYVPAPARSFLRGLQEQARDLRSLGAGMLVHASGGTTPPAAYHAMRRLYCSTGGRVNHAAGWYAAARHPRIPVDNPVGVLGTMDGAALDAALRDLRQHGYHRFAATLPPETVEALRAHAETQPCVPTVASVSGAPSRGEPGLYRACADQSSRFDFTSEVSLGSPAVQALAADRSLLQVAGHHLGCEPVLDLVAMWWSRPQPGGRDLRSEAAQLYHFDMDRFRFLKFFFYLTDVDAMRGPHCFVEGSHREKPAAAWKDGRWTDADLEALFGRERFRELTGPAGTILAVDTSGFHKGKEVMEGERLLLQLEYSISTFGQNYPLMPVRPGTALAAFASEHPRVTSAMDLQG